MSLLCVTVYKPPEEDLEAERYQLHSFHVNYYSVIMRGVSVYYYTYVHCCLQAINSREEEKGMGSVGTVESLIIISVCFSIHLMLHMGVF
jgi:hypothetical protein